MKRLIIILSILLCGIENVSAYNFIVDGITYTNSSSSTCYVTYEGDTYIHDAGTGYSGDIVIPSHVTYDNREFEVTAVGEYAFYNCTLLKSVSLPSTIKDIGKAAFSGCRSLLSVNIPDGITIIHEYTFEGCKELSSITIPNTVSVIGEQSFNGCESLSSINLENISAIREYAFCGSSIKELQINRDAKIEIGEHAFAHCDSLHSVNLSSKESVVTGDEAFARCQKLQCVKIAGGKVLPGEKAFEYNDSLSSVEISGNLVLSTMVGSQKYVFQFCKNLKSVIISGECNCIAEGTFRNCYSLSSVILPQNNMKRT